MGQRREEGEGGRDERGRGRVWAVRKWEIRKGGMG